MAAPHGIALIDLLDLPPGSLHLLPDDIRRELEKLSILDYKSASTPAVFVYYGTVRSLGDAFFPSSLNWPIELPLVNAGVPFQLTRRRVAPGAGENLEPAADNFQIDLLLNLVSIVVPGLRPAKLVDSSGTTAAHLVADAQRNTVRITGSGTLRIASNPTGGGPIIRFVSAPDPLDPDTPTGAVFSLGFDPPHFFIGGSDFGMTVDRLTYDDSEVFTPPEILARGQAPAWRGISIKEATLYFPRNAPVVGDLSIGVRDVLLGTPLGMQGEIRIELGTTPVDPATIDFFQMLANGTESHLGGASGTDRTRLVTLAAGTSSRTRVRAVGPAGSRNRFRLPAGDTIEAQATPYFDVTTGSRLIAQGVEGTGSDAAVSPEVTFTFNEAAPPSTVPKIDVQTSSATRANVASVSGSSSALQALTFRSNPSTSTVRWQLGAGPTASNATAADFTPAVPSSPGTYDLVLTDANNRTRRVRIDVLPQGDLIIGSAAGVFDSSGAVNVRAVEATYNLVTFETQGELSPGSPDATVASGTVTAAAGTLAAVTLERGSQTNPEAPATPAPAPQPKRHLQILMDFNTANEMTWGDEGLSEPFSQDVLSRWAASFTGAQFMVIGRTCDIGTTNRNRDLCQERAQRGKTLLTAGGSGTPVPASSVHARGEQHTWAASGDAGGAALDGPAGLASDEGEAAVGVGPHNGWLFKIRFGTFTDQNPDAHGRRAYRRVDIYAVGGTTGSSTPQTTSEISDRAQALRRALVPGADPSAIAPVTPRDRALPYRVRLVVRWDSPTVTQLSDAIPTQAELTIAWQSSTQALPGAGSGNSVQPRLTNPPASGPEIFTFIGTWAYDPRSGQTQFTLALNSAGDPNGLAFIGGTGASTAENILATALGLGPALMSGISSADVAGGAARIGALIAACVVAAAFARDGKIVLYGIKLEWRQRALDTLEGSRQRLLFDYTAQIGFDINAFGIHVVADRPIKIRYQNVGVELDNSRDGLDRFGLVYENVSFDIEDPGQWTINGPLGELLRVAGTRAGSGSTWIEVDLRFALDLGVIRITGCTLRVNFPTGAGSLGIEFRGFRAGVTIPGVIEGSGMLSIGDGGAIRAGIDVNIIPAKVLARGSLAIQGSFTAIEIILILPVGLPLAQSGLAIYGFAGRFVSNGQRQITSVSPDPIQKEVDWYRQPAPTKYTGPAQGQFALGLGVVIGTMPDTGFTFNALGMFTISFPDVSVIFSIDANFFKLPALPREDGAPPSAGLNLLGIIAIDSNAVKIAVRGSYTIPETLILEVPFGAFFPLPGKPGEAYVRVGADGFAGRVGDTVTLRLLPSTLDVSVWAFLMCEARSLHQLGGEPSFNLDGFSIGFGAGFSLQWGGGPIFLRVSAKILVGIGTKPLTIVGGIFIRGELRLIIISVSLSGEITAIITEDRQVLHGRFCGEIDFFFFSISGCVEVTFGSGSAPGIPTPDHPLTRIDLTDRAGAITGRTVRTGTSPASGDPPSVVWPDTVPLLNFASYIQNRMPASSQFKPSPAELPGPQWSGSSELKYAYRLKEVSLVKIGSGAVAGPLESVWWWPTHRSGVLNPADPPPSEQEGRMLALLSWFPAPWSRHISDGGEGTPGDPSGTVGRICDPVPRPKRNCAFGQNTERKQLDQVSIRPNGPSDGPLPNYFEINGLERGSEAISYSAYLSALSSLGAHIVPGKIVPLGGSIPGITPPINSAYELPYAAKQSGFLNTLDFLGTFAPAVSRPELTLALCGRADVRQAGDKICDAFTDIVPKTPLATEFVRNGVRYRWATPPPAEPSPAVDFFPPTSGDGKTELWLGAKGLWVVPPTPVSNIEVDVAYFFGQTRISVRAFDRIDGKLLAEVTSPLQPNVRHTLRLSAEGIGAVLISGGNAVSANSVSPRTAGVLLRFCYESGFNLPKDVDLFPASKTDFPEVIGILHDGSQASWTPKLAEVAPTLLNIPCKLVSYVPPKDGVWAAFEIKPWSRTHLEIVSVCGVNWQWQTIASEDQQVRIDTVNQFNAHATSTSAETRDVLDSSATYEIRVKCQWRGWRKTDSAPQPPPLDDSGWTDFPDAVYRFSTAPAAVLPSNPPPFEFTNETQFDPRGVNRYLIGFRPDGLGAPHFLDDTLAVDFSVDHLQKLLTKYGRDLKLKVRRTDPPAASLTGFVKPPDLLTTIAFKDLPLTMKAVADQRLIRAAIEAPCVNPPKLGGQTAEITAPLEPNAEYDLLFVAPPTGSSSDEVLVARGHFHSSRYRNAAELLAAVGFKSPTPYPVLPLDAFVNAVAPPAVSLRNDADLQNTLTSLGLDPWPLPDQPRTVVLWRKVGATYSVAGLLLDSDEPMERGPRLSFSSASCGGVPMTLRRSNAAGTRLLVMPNLPLSFPIDPTLILTLAQPGGTVTGSRYLSRGPRILLQEAV